MREMPPFDFASSRFIAFLDDDMEITKNWIDGLVKVAVEHAAGVVFGPLIAKFADAADPKNTYLSSFYARHSKQTEAGVSDEAFGTGGCLIDLESCVLPSPAFDTRLNESGGRTIFYLKRYAKTVQDLDGLQARFVMNAYRPREQHRNILRNETSDMVKVQAASQLQRGYPASCNCFVI